MAKDCDTSKKAELATSHRTAHRISTRFVGSRCRQMRRDELRSRVVSFANATVVVTRIDCALPNRVTYAARSSLAHLVRSSHCSHEMHFEKVPSIDRCDGSSIACMRTTNRLHYTHIADHSCHYHRCALTSVVRSFVVPSGFVALRSRFVVPRLIASIRNVSRSHRTETGSTSNSYCSQ